MNELLEQAKLLTKSEQLELSAKIAENVALSNNEPQNGALKQIANALRGSIGASGAKGADGAK